MPPKRSIRMKRAKKSTRSNNSVRLKSATRLTRGGMWAIAAAVMCVLAGAMVIGARQGSESTIVARRNAPLETAAAEVAARKAPASRALPLETARTPAAMATTVNAPAAEPADDAPMPVPGSVTITGCLERADDTFRLKDTTGTDAVKARSWKSGFLKKRAPSIDVVDAANRLKLPDHVGQRVRLTGTLVDREMQVRSLQRISASCGGNRKET
jgi:hypothetical protein